MSSTRFLGSPSNSIKEWIYVKKTTFTLNVDGSATATTPFTPDVNGILKFKGNANPDGTLTV